MSSIDEVGPVRFEDADGGFLADKWYAKHAFLRPFQIAFSGRWYEQNRKDGVVWVYRAVPSSQPGQMTDDPALIDIPADDPPVQEGDDVSG